MRREKIRKEEKIKKETLFSISNDWGMEVKMDKKDKKTNDILEQNVLLYYENKLKIDALEEEQEELKTQNLQLAKMLGLEKGDIIIFDSIGLQIQLIEMIKKEGVDQDGLIAKYGKEKTEYLMTIPVKAVEMAIKLGKLPEDAEDFINKADPIEYTKVSSVGYRKIEML